MFVTNKMGAYSSDSIVCEEVEDWKVAICLSSSSTRFISALLLSIRGATISFTFLSTYCSILNVVCVISVGSASSGLRGVGIGVALLISWIG